jgi:hypothetical protein
MPRFEKRLRRLSKDITSGNSRRKARSQLHQVYSGEYYRLSSAGRGKEQIKKAVQGAYMSAHQHAKTVLGITPAQANKYLLEGDEPIIPTSHQRDYL